MVPTGRSSSHGRNLAHFSPESRRAVVRLELRSVRLETAFENVLIQGTGYQFSR